MSVDVCDGGRKVSGNKNVVRFFREGTNLFPVPPVPSHKEPHPEDELYCTFGIWRWGVVSLA